MVMVIVIVILIENDSLQRYFSVFELGCSTWSCFFLRGHSMLASERWVWSWWPTAALVFSTAVVSSLACPCCSGERQKYTWNIITIFFNRLAWIDFDLDLDTFQGAWVLILTLITFQGAWGLILTLIDTFQGAWGLRQLGFPDWQLQCHRKVRGCSQIYVYLFLVSWCGRCSFFFEIWWLCIWFDDNMVLGKLCRFCHQGKQIISDLLISEARGRAFPWRCNKWDHPVRTWLQLLLVQSTIALIGAHNYKSIKTGARDLLYLQWTIGGNGSRCCKWRYCANGQDWWQHRNPLHIKT